MIGRNYLDQRKEKATMYIKGFDENLCCRGFQFEVGKEYKTKWNGENPLRLCSEDVFHFCDSLEKIHIFYSCKINNRFCEIEVLGDLVKDKAKCGSNHIRILREITGDELNKLKRLTNGNTGFFNSGFFNSGDYNVGNYNSGDFNSGNYNSGDFNSGLFNSGNYNSGNYNSGFFNCGFFNSGFFNSGFFNTDEPTVRLFNKNTNIKFSDFLKSKYYKALSSSQFILTKYKEDKLITYDYKEACEKWWDNMTEDNKEIIKTMPNFDKDIFKEITGIEV